MPNFSACNSEEPMNLQNRISKKNFISPCLITSKIKSLTSLFSVYNPTAYMYTCIQKEKLYIRSEAFMTVGIQTKSFGIKCQTVWQLVSWLSSTIYQNIMHPFPEAIYWTWKTRWEIIHMQNTKTGQKMLLPHLYQSHHKTTIIYLPHLTLITCSRCMFANNPRNMEAAHQIPG